MNESIQNQLRDITKDSYREYHKNLNDSVSLKPIYLGLLNEYEKISPVHRTFESVSFPQEIAQYNNIIVVANHLPTPHLININDSTFFNEIQILPEDIIHPAYDPNEFRHYPVVNTLLPTHETHLIINEKPNTLGRVLRKCGHILIPAHYPGKRTEFLIQEFQKRIDACDKNACIIFPEGRDTEGFLDQYIYYMFDLRTGFAVIAKELNLPILPISIAFDTETFEHHAIIHNFINQKQVEGKTITELTQTLKETFTRGIPQALSKVNVIWISEQHQSESLKK